MTPVVLPAGIIAASLAMAYFCCIRPMRKGQCAMQGPQSSADIELELALLQARADLEKLRSSASADGATA